MSDVTLILDRARKGDLKAADELLPLIYEELRQLATAKMARQPPAHQICYVSERPSKLSVIRPIPRREEPGQVRFLATGSGRSRKPG